MKVRQTVNYYDMDSGERRSGVIRKITGAGKSRAKILTLEVGEETIEGVHHLRDAGVEDSFWLIKGRESAPAGWANRMEEQEEEEEE